MWLAEISKKTKTRAVNHLKVLIITTLILTLQTAFSQDLEELKKQAEMGDVDAQVKLGRALIFGENNTKKDMDAGARWIVKAAEKKDLYAEYFYGLILTYGLGMPKNPKKAVELLNKAADENNVKQVKVTWDAYRQLLNEGYRIDGKNMDYQSEQAIKWIKLAADNGIPEAQGVLAVLYYTGDGVEKDVKKAAKYIRLSADNGYKPAIPYVSRFEYEAMNPIQKWFTDREKAKAVEQRKMLVEQRKRAAKENEVANLLREIRDQNAELIELSRNSSERTAYQEQQSYSMDFTEDIKSQRESDQMDDLQRQINKASMWDAIQSRRNE